MASYDFSNAGNPAVYFSSQIVDTLKRDGVMMNNVNAVLMPNSGQIFKVGQTVEVPFPVLDLTNVGADHTSRDDMAIAWAESGNMTVGIEKVADVFIASESVDNSVERFDALSAVMPTAIEHLSKQYDDYVIGKVLGTTEKTIGDGAVASLDEVVLLGSDKNTVLDWILELSIMAEGAGVDRVHVGYRAFTALKNEIGAAYLDMSKLGKANVIRNINGLDIVHNHRINDKTKGVAVDTFAQGPRTINGVWGINTGRYIPDLEMKTASAYKSVSAYGASVFGDELILASYQIGDSVVS